MNIKHRLKSIALASTLVFTATAFQTSFADIYGNPNYQVTNVATWDALNLRSGPGTSEAVIDEIPANTSGITLTGDQENVGESIWVKVKWNGRIGWVNQRYLTVAQAQTQQASQTTVASNSTGAYQHTHPAIPGCTRTVTHTHASNDRNHTHRYSCNNRGRQQIARAQQQVVVQNNMKQTYYNPYTDIYGNSNIQRTANTQAGAYQHTHAAIPGCTNTVTHSHASNNPNHQHKYSCRGNGRQVQTVRQRRVYGTNLSHTHPKSQCVSAITHSHRGGQRIHRHECPSSGRQAAAGGMHTHPANSLTRATTHSHPYQDRNHTHRYAR